MGRSQPTLQDLGRHISHVIPLFWIVRENHMPIVTLTVDDYATCDAVARAVAAVRRDGKIAGLDF
jgi:hypothetical protein